MAVSINENKLNTKHEEQRCLYLKELLPAINADIEDISGNIVSLNKWNNNMNSIIKKIQNNELAKTDSLYTKLGMIGNYIYFIQRSKTKIEELKYSAVNLIHNKDLKNRILLYQNDKIDLTRRIESEYDFVGKELRRYYSRHFIGYNYGEAIPINLKKLEQDKTYLSLIKQRLHLSSSIVRRYKVLLKEQLEIKENIKSEIDICKN